MTMPRGLFDSDLSWFELLRDRVQSLLEPPRDSLFAASGLFQRTDISIKWARSGEGAHEDPLSSRPFAKAQGLTAP
jgi:hypothetical protein